MKKINERVVFEETPVDLVVNGKMLVTFLCTPQFLDDLAVGYLFSHGLISGLDDIQSCRVSGDLRKIFVSLKEVPPEQYELAHFLSIAYGNGSLYLNKLSREQKVNSNFTINQSKIQDLCRQMESAAVLYRKTGGVHCAALANESKLVAWREDIGRHNSIDKVIGRALLTGVDLSRHFIITTGRIASDMVLKTVVGRTPLMVSRSIPSNLAVEIADKLGVTLVGRAFGPDPIVYTYPWRVVARKQEKVIYKNLLFSIHNISVDKLPVSNKPDNQRLV